MSDTKQLWHPGSSEPAYSFVQHTYLHLCLKTLSKWGKLPREPQATGGLFFLVKVESGTEVERERGASQDKRNSLTFFPFRSSFGTSSVPSTPPVKRGRGPFKARPSLPQNFPVSALFDPGRPARLAAELVGDRAAGSGRAAGGTGGTHVAAPEGGRGTGCGSSRHGRHSLHRARVVGQRLAL